MAGKEYCVYIMTNAHNTVLYTGVTNHLQRQVYEHKSGRGGIFTKQFNVTKLVYYEVTDHVQASLVREKQIKGGSRRRKIELVNRINPEWEDLYDGL